MKHFISSTCYELKQAYSSLKQKPLFVFSVVSTMGITLGALLCVLTLTYVILIKPLPYPEQGQLYVAKHKIVNAKKETQKVAFSYPGLLHLYQSKSAFEQAAMLYYDQEVIRYGNNQALFHSTYVTPEFHQMLASPIAVGRIFESSESLGSNNPVAMLSYNTWQQNFNGSADVLEQTIDIRGVSYRIIGVLAENFIEPELAEIGRKTQVWLPWDFNSESTESRQNFGNIKNNFHFIGRLPTRTSQNQAQQLLTPLVSKQWQAGFVAKYDFFQGWSVVMQVQSLQTELLGDNKSISIMLLAGVVGLILIASTNIANLFLARTAENQHKMAIQTVIGANKKHLFKGVLAETSLLMFLSIILALVIANIGFTIMQRYLSDTLPRISELSLNFITLSSAVLIALAFTLFFTKLSTRMINNNTLNTALQNSGKGSGLQVSKKARYVLVASQITLAITLVFANVSLLKDAIKTIYTPIGFVTNNISALTLNFFSNEVTSEENSQLILAEIMKKLDALPQVKSITQTSSPIDGYGVKALTRHANSVKYIPHFKRIDERYFAFIEQPLLQGKNITRTDRKENNNVLIINQAFATQLNADGNVIGMQLSSIGEPDFKIIGIVKDIIIPGQTAFGSDDITLAVPRAYAPNSLHEQNFMLKTKEHQSVNRQQLAKVISEVDPRYSVFSFTAVDNILTKKLFTVITTAVTTLALTLITLFLASIGLYGILSYSTQMRKFEIGTRMAIGAKRSDLIRLIIQDNSQAILLGIGISVLLITGLVLGFSEQLSQYLTWQLIPLFLVTLGLVSLISFAACYLPLRQYINKPAVYSLRGSE